MQSESLSNLSRTRGRKSRLNEGGIFSPEPRIIAYKSNQREKERRSGFITNRCILKALRGKIRLPARDMMMMTMPIARPAALAFIFDSCVPYILERNEEFEEDTRISLIYIFFVTRKES